MTTTDFIIFFIYLIGITLYGSSFMKKNKSSEAFTLGSRHPPSWIIALSIFATFVSSISFLALPGNAYMTNWNAFVFSLSIPFALFIAIKYFVPLYRKERSPSAYTFLETRFGPWARIYASACYLLTQIMRVGAILYLLALTLNAVVGWNVIAIIVITGVTVTIYSLLGGFAAVVWTDAIQGLCLIGGALATVVYILLNMPGGAGEAFSIAAAHNKFSLGSFGSSLAAPTFWVVLLYGFFVNLQNYGIDQNYVQRYMASKTEKQAKRSAFWGGIIYVPVSAFFIFIGTALFSFYHSGAAILPESLQQPAMSDRIFPYFIVTQLPPGLRGLLIASVFAAGMSTISTSFNSSATVLLTDYFRRFSKKSISPKKSMRILYLSSFCISAVAIAVAIIMIDVKSALDAWWKLASVFSGGMLGLFLLAAFSKYVTNRGAVAGIIAGIVVIIWMTIIPFLKNTVGVTTRFHSYLVIVFATTAIIIVGFLATLLITPKTVKNR